MFSWLASHSRSIFFTVLALAASGAVIGTHLPVSLFPQVAFPRIAVSVDVGDRPADETALDITRPLELALRAVNGVTDIKSTTSRGSADISVNFNWGDDMIQSMLEVQAAINQVSAQFPSTFTYEVRRMDPTVFPVAAISLTSDSKTLSELNDLAEYQLKPRLSTVTGLAKVTVLGGHKQEIRVDVNEDKLHALSLSLQQISDAISQQTVLTSVGRIEQQYHLYLLMADNRANSINALEDLVIRHGPHGVVHLSDIATVHYDVEPMWRRVNANGKDAVLVQFYQQSGGNTVQIVKQIRQQLATIKANLAGNVHIAMWYDQSDLITQSASGVTDAMIVGLGLAGLILLLFLRNVKITLIAVSVVPLALSATMLLLHLLHMSINIMTLGGMAAAIGLMIDDVIVMLEHITHRMAGPSSPSRTRIYDAAREFTQPLAGSSAATIVIFIPLAFLDGVTGAFFKALSLTMASCLILSFFMAWLVVPVVTEKLLAAKDLREYPPLNVEYRIRRGVTHLARLASRSGWLVALVVAALLAVSYSAYRHVGSEFMPHMDEGGFILDYRSPPGTSLAETDRLMRRVEKIIQADPAVDTYSRRTGAQLGGGLTEANEGDMFVRLKPMPRAPIDEVMSRLRTNIEQHVPGLEIEMALLMEDLIGDLISVPQPIEIKLFNDDVSKLTASAKLVAEKIARIPGVVDVNDGINLAGDAYTIVIDNDKAALRGIDTASAYKQLADMFDGNIATRVQTDVKMVNVRVWVPHALKHTADDFNHVWLVNNQGRQIALKDIANLQKNAGQPQINRDNLKRDIAVTARLDGTDLGTAMKRILTVLAENKAALQGSYFRIGGLYQQQQQAFHDLTIVFIAALAVLLALILFLYNDFAIAMVMLTSATLAAGCVFIGLWITNTPLNITAIMGMTMILGIVTEVSVFYFSQFQFLCKGGGAPDKALFDAVGQRFRPILMTSLAAILALLPLALGRDPGTQMQQPLAIAIISGLLIQMPLVLIIAPALYRILPNGLKAAEYRV